MLVYGLANVVNDAWHEQLYKRGWVSTKLPDVTVPEWNVGWAVVLIASAALATVVLYRLGGGQDGAPPPERISV
jgi:hypothetical protein